ncbi:MAG: AtpZ/AtpI family protein [Candidatus Omnitrophota bacterium]
MVKEKQFFFYVGIILELGLTFSISVLVGLFVGIFFDKKLHTSPLCTIIFLIFGIIGGFMSAYKLIKEEGFFK